MSIATRQDRLYSVLLAPIVSEKSTMIGEKNDQVAFRVMQDATKLEVKAAVELLFMLQRVQGPIGDDSLALLFEAITLADGLRHRPAQAVIRYLRARRGPARTRSKTLPGTRS